MDDLLKRLSELVAEGESEQALELVDKAFEQGMDPLVILNEGAAKGMDIVSAQYSSGEAYLPELVLAGDAMAEVIDVIFSHMDAGQAQASRAGVVVFGQAKGDVHDIGKNICIALLAVNGFEVHDLGTDVPVKDFIEKADEVNADFIAVSTLLTTSLPFLEDTLQYLKDTDKRNKYRYIVGGGPVTAEFATKIGADGWSRNAFDCVQMCKQLMETAPGQNETLIIDSEAATA